MVSVAEGAAGALAGLSLGAAGLAALTWLGQRQATGLPISAQAQDALTAEAVARAATHGGLAVVSAAAALVLVRGGGPLRGQTVAQIAALMTFPMSCLAFIATGLLRGGSITFGA